MTNKYLQTGIMLFALEVVGLIAFLVLTQINWTADLFVKVIVGSSVLIFNLVAFILLVVGIVSKEK